MRKFSLFLSFLVSLSLQAQTNLVPNPSFEEYFDCDYITYLDDLKSVIPYWAALNTSPRYMNMNCLNSSFSSNFQSLDICTPQDGQGFIFCAINPRDSDPTSGWDYREYSQVLLLDTLKQGKSYYISYYLTLPFENESALSDYGIYFSDIFIEEDVQAGFPNFPIILDPQIEIDTIPDLSFGVWQKFTHCFIPSEDYTVMTVGIFEDQANILGIEDITHNHTWIAYDNYFIAEIDTFIALNDFPDTICVGEVIELSTNHSLFDGRFEWSLPGSSLGQSFDSVVQVSYGQAGVYEIAAKVEHCGGKFERKFPEKITVLAPINFLDYPDRVICAGDTIQVQLPTAYSVLWSDGSTEHDRILSQIGNYSFVLRNEACSKSYSFDLSFFENPREETQNLQHCKGESSFFLGKSYPLEGTFFDTLENSMGCDSIYYKIMVEEFPLSASPIVGMLEFCEGDSSLVSISEYVASVLWEDGSTDKAHLYKEAGDYPIQYTDLNGCVFLDTLRIRTQERPAIQTANITNVWFEEGIELPVMYLGEISQYQWSNGAVLNCSDCPFPYLIAPKEGIYQIEVWSAIGCSAFGELEVDFNEIRVYLPNIISKNSTEHQNQVLFAQSNFPIQYNLSVYDRWGGLLFHKENAQSDSLSDGWLPSEKTAVGVYTFVVEFEELGQKKVLAASVTVID